MSPILLPPLDRSWHEFVAAAVERLLLARPAGHALRAGGRVPRSPRSLGCIIGYLVSRSRYSVRVFDPLFAGHLLDPGDPAVPALRAVLRPRRGSKIAIGATIAFFPVVLNTIAGFGYVDGAYVTAARSMGASAAADVLVGDAAGGVPGGADGLAHGLHPGVPRRSSAPRRSPRSPGSATASCPTPRAWIRRRCSPTSSSPS